MLAAPSGMMHAISLFDFFAKVSAQAVVEPATVDPTAPLIKGTSHDRLLRRQGFDEQSRSFLHRRCVDRARDRQAIELVSPATEQITGHGAEAVEADVKHAVAAARRAFDEGHWPRMSASERGRRLGRLAMQLRARADELAHAWTGQMGAVHLFAQGSTEVSLSLFDFQVQQAHHSIWEEQRPTMYPGSVGLVTREPVGVVATIAPWNAPFFSMAIKVAPALMAGCTTRCQARPRRIRARLGLCPDPKRACRF